MALKVDMKNLPTAVKAVIAILPSVVISLLIIFLLIMPKQEQIKKLDKKIDEQNNQIAASETKAAKLDVLKKENERLQTRLNELKEQLPVEKEISNLLKQVSDQSINSGLEIKAWKPGQKTKHSSGIVYEIPVSVAVTGRYHNVGYFLSSLTKFNRIININDMKLTSTPEGLKKARGAGNILNVSFTASTFSSVEEGDADKKDGDKGKKADASPAASGSSGGVLSRAEKVRDKATAVNVRAAGGL